MVQFSLQALLLGCGVLRAATLRPQAECSPFSELGEGTCNGSPLLMMSSSSAASPSTAAAEGIRAPSLLQGKFHGIRRRQDAQSSSDEEALPRQNLAPRRSLLQTASRNNSRLADAPARQELGPAASLHFLDVQMKELAIGLVSGRREYWYSLHRAFLQFAQGVIIDVDGECPCSFRAGFVTLRETYPDAKWYYVGDEDVFLNLHSMVEMLDKLDPTVPTVIARPGFHTIEDVCGMEAPSGVGSEGRVFFGGSGHILSAAMLDALNYQQPCAGEFLHADQDHSCFLLSQWQPHFRFHPLPYSKLIFEPADATEAQLLELAKHHPVVHKVTPEQQDLLQDVNVDIWSLREVNMSDPDDGRPLWPRVVRTYQSADCDVDAGSCSNTCIRSAEGTAAEQRVSFFLHLAKAAGTSASLDLPEHHLSQGNIFLSDEICYGAVPHNADIITFLREPRSHVYSQYNMCLKRQESPGANLHPLEMPSLPDWLSHWKYYDRGSQIEPLDCYLPVDMQTRLLSCNSPRFCPANDRAVLEHSSNISVDFPLAKERITSSSEVKFVGIVELYQESMCLIHIRSLNHFPSYCNCNEASWNEFPMQEKTHDVPKHDMSDLNNDTLSLIDDITSYDRQLYALAKQRLIREIHEVERLYGRRILCNHDNSTHA